MSDLVLPALPDALRAQGFTLRPRQAADQAGVDALYQQWRIEQFIFSGLPLADCQHLAAQQCHAQRQYYRQLDGGPLVWGVLVREGACVGRLYLQRRGADLHVLDLLLCPAQRSQGVGSALLAATRAHVHALGCTQLSLQVEMGNPRALALYLRLGFVLAGVSGVHGWMVWPSDTA